MTYSRHIQNRVTPQSSPIPGREADMVQNSAGGYVFQVDDWGRLDRFLVLGSEGATYYATERDLTISNAQAVIRCIKADGPRTVRQIRDVSFAGRAAKNKPAIFALALCMAYGNTETKQAVRDALPDVARYATDMFAFVQEAKALRGWGRSFRGAVANWYTEKSPTQLAYQLIKYQNRDGWTHKDVLRLAHPVTDSADHNALFHYAVKGWDEVGSDPHPNANLVQVWAAERAKQATEKQIIALINQYNLPRECVPTHHLKSASVWEALLEKMPMTAMIRNLATMTRVGLLAPMSSANNDVINKLVNRQNLQRARIHPLAILVALNTYAKGRSERGDATWTPVKRIVDALNDSFYEAFAAISPSGKRTLLAIDVSGSMNDGQISGMTGVTPRIGSAVMALVTARVEPNYELVAFSHVPGARIDWGNFRRQGDHNLLTPINITPRQRLDDVITTINGIPMGGTDCALPMLHAMKNNIPVDTFVIYTDNETWAGTVHPKQALDMYAQKSGIQAKLVVVAMTATQFTIADPSRSDMLE